jgi:hypothetical protein
MFNILVLQIEDRSDDSFLNENMRLNKDICQKNNMQYKFLYKSQDNVPPYWAKVFEIDRILNDNTNVDYIFWIDSDAFFINFNKNRLTTFLTKNSEYSMIITKDPPPWKMSFNAGSFIVKNDSYSREIFSYWKSLYNPDNWWIEDNKWKTDKPYAGNDYEQGAFATKILTNSQYSTHIKTVPYYILNNTSCTENTKETIVTHLAGNHKHNITKVENCKNVIHNDGYYIYFFIVVLGLLLCLLVFVFVFHNKKWQKTTFHKFNKFFTRTRSM